MLTLLRNQPVQGHKHRALKDVERIFLLASKLQPIEQDFGDCVETDIYPGDIRQDGYRDGIAFLIRQVSTTKWRVWRKS